MRHTLNLTTDELENIKMAIICRKHRINDLVKIIDDKDLLKDYADELESIEKIEYKLYNA